MIIILLVGVITWGVGVFVLLARPGERAAGALQWSLICMGISTMLAWGRTPPGELFPLASRALFLVAYSGVGATFLFFTTLFPRQRFGSVPVKAALIFFPAVVVLGILLATHLSAVSRQSFEQYRLFHGWYDGFQVFRRWGMTIVFPVPGENNVVPGFIVLGEKKSGGRFTAEDVDLLAQVAAEAGLALERIVLHRSLLLEQAEAHRLDELNRMKSDFVSYVSHELRTPLRSI